MDVLSDCAFNLRSLWLCCFQRLGGSDSKLSVGKVVHLLTSSSLAWLLSPPNKIQTSRVVQAAFITLPQKVPVMKWFNFWSSYASNVWLWSGSIAAIACETLLLENCNYYSFICQIKLKGSTDWGLVSSSACPDAPGKPITRAGRQRFLLFLLSCWYLVVYCPKHGNSICSSDGGGERNRNDM